MTPKLHEHMVESSGLQGISLNSYMIKTLSQASGYDKGLTYKKQRIILDQLSKEGDRFSLTGISLDRINRKDLQLFKT